jgi:NADH-quinone oxidoreductase subunit G
VPFDDPYSDNVIGICPTGALLSSDFLYKSRVWFLEPVVGLHRLRAGLQRAGLAPHEAARAALPGGEKKNEAYRITALDNPAINGPWLCNKGFDLHKQASRTPTAAPGGRPACGGRQALAEARRLLAQARTRPCWCRRRPPTKSWMPSRRSSAPGFAYVRQDVLPADGEVLEDKLLIRADKNPNSYGVAARFGAEDFKPEAGHDLVLVWGEYRRVVPIWEARVSSIWPTSAPPGRSRLMC